MALDEKNGLRTREGKLLESKQEANHRLFVLFALMAPVADITRAVFTGTAVLVESELVVSSISVRPNVTVQSFPFLEPIQSLTSIGNQDNGYLFLSPIHQLPLQLLVSTIHLHLLKAWCTCYKTFKTAWKLSFYVCLPDW